MLKRTWATIKSNYYLFAIFNIFAYLSTFLISDKVFRKLMFYSKYKRILNLDNPQGFNAKIHKRTLFDRNDIYTKLADKYLVREFVEAKIGSEYLIPLLAVYKKPKDIKLDNLPNSFVMKCNHDSGKVIICNDKTELDIKKIRYFFKTALIGNMYLTSREWHYKNIKKLILVEEKINIYVNDSTPEDYKFHCFNGMPKYIEVQFSRYSGDRRINIYDLNWNLQPFKMGFENTNTKIPKPTQLSKMVQLVEKLCNNFDYCRVDLYLTKEEKIYFGEITFTPCNGMDVFIPFEWDEKFAEDWDI